MPLPVASKDVQRRTVRAVREVGGTGPTTVALREFLDDATILHASLPGRSPSFAITYPELVALHLSARGRADVLIAGVLGLPPAAVAALVDVVDERLSEACAAHLSEAEADRPN